MKKIYLSLAGLILCGSMIGQNATTTPQRKHMKAVLAPNAKIPTHIKADSRAAGPFSLWVEPVGDVMTQLGVDETGGTTAPSQDIFVDGVYQDSTTTISDPTNGTSSIFNILLGSVLDPKSANLQASFDPIVTKFDSYTIDSLQILGSYVKKTAAVDTLYTWLVWGDSTNTNVFAKRLDNSVWVAPIGTWRHSVIGPKVTGATSAQGNKVKASAPSTNMMLIPYVLQPSDSTTSGHVKFISMALSAPVTIPAGNIVSCFYTFVPGGTHNVGDCEYSFSGAPATQNVNGFAGSVWGQTAPAVAALADYQPQQVDPTSWCMGTSYSANQRYSSNASYNNSLMGDLVTAAVIEYSISGTSTQSVNELEKYGFALGQNTPNPFTNQTKINYQLKNAASNVALEVYDIRGVKMFAKTQTDVREGRYSIEVNNTNFASGIYFYSLIVDGNKITKKMIVQ